ncbi:hypothetical protein M0812_07893 [Anaeramoeba flamelloides]|uniref:TNFR-Cys domain-containing protein n=1 Tax=Anaeramoeba flamelloides TaxID=1746091 RepID=A0AAV8A2W5_9EUKA|nr:hypothetical protein M0812_07893 [Anaeramoeba flamelloides]
MKTISWKNYLTFLILILVLTNKVFLNCQRYVKVDASNPNDGCDTEENACSTIEDAVGRSSNGDLICVGPGTYFFDDQIEISLDLTLIATSYPEEETIIDGEFSITRAFKLVQNNFVIDGFTIQNFESGSEEGVPFYTQCDAFQASKSINFINCNITNNQAMSGAIKNYGCNIDFENVRIQDNTAIDKGAGLRCDRNVDSPKAEITFSNLIISNNQANTDFNIFNDQKTGQGITGAACSVNGADLKNCDVCDNGGNCNLETGDCECLAGSSTPSPECEFCFPGEYSTGINNGSCSRCKAGEFNTKSGQTRCHKCEIGQYQNSEGQTECKECGKGSFTNQTGQTQCQKCDPGQYQDQIGQRICNKCDPGFYNENEGSTSIDACLSCPTGTYNTITGATSASDCSDCAVGHYNSENGQTICQECDPGQYQDQIGQRICNKCDPGFYNENEGSTSIDACQSCPTGTYNTITGATSASDCSDCAVGHYNSENGQTICQECDPGQYQNETGQNICQECGIGSFTNQTGQTKCQKCDPGQYQDQIGQRICNKCDPGFYNENEGSTSIDACLSCPTGTYNTITGATSASDCSDCAVGHYNSEIGQHTCQECETGYYTNETRQTQCQECGIGTYTDQKGLSQCQKCEVGRYQNETRQSNCQECETGYFANEKGQTVCKKCETGSYTDKTGQSQCSKCDKGNYQNEKGKSFCSKCDPGYFMNEIGQEKCQKCGIGSYTDQTGQTKCQQCEMGYYNSQEGQSKCQECEKGYFANGIGQQQCQECEAGSYTDQTGQIKCQKCDVGGYQDEKGQEFCKKCLIGSFNSKVGSISENDCIQCEIGYYSDQEASSSCKLCSQGKYNKNRNSTSCLDCPAGSYSDREGQTFCKYCAAGKYQDKEGGIKCEACPFNTWQSSTGSNECNYCPMNSITLTTNTINPLECFCSVGYYGKAGQSCEKCPNNGICDELNQQNPKPIKGYWSSETSPQDLIKCKIEDACPGNAIGNCNDQLGYTGFKCEECMGGFYKFEDQCLICPDNNWTRLMFAFFLLFISVIVLIFVAKKGENYFGSLTILVSFFQIIVLFPKMLFNWPFKIQNFFKNFTFFNLNIDILALECSLNLTYTQKWFMIMLLPIVIIFLFVSFYCVILIHTKIIKKIGTKLINKFPSLFIKPSDFQQNKYLKPFAYLRYYLFSFWTNGMDKNDLKVFKNNCINSFVAFLFLMYLILCLKILEIFDCSKISDSNNQNESYALKVNLQYNCYDDWWYKMLPFVIIFGILYIIGIPIFLGWSLYYHSRKVDENTFNQRFGLLTNKFKKEWFFWEFVLTFRKIIVVIIVLYLSNFPNIQIIFFILIFLLSILIQSYCNPFNTTPRNFLEFSLLVITQFILIGGLYFVSDEFKNSSDKTKDLVANFIIFFLFLSILLWVLIVFIEIKSKIKSKNKQTSSSSSSSLNINGNQKKNKNNLINEKKNMSQNEKKFIQVIQNKSNFLIILKYLGSVSNSKKIFNFFNFIKQFIIDQQSNNEKITIKNQNMINCYQNIWIHHLSRILLGWYKNKSTIIQKISFSRLLNYYIMFIIQNPQNNQNKNRKRLFSLKKN